MHYHSTNIPFSHQSHFLYQQQNRPFSVQNIVDALQKHGVKKAAVERSLAALLKKETITKKEYGKAKVFIRDQSSIEIPDPEETAKVTEKISELTGVVKDLDKKIGNVEGEVRSLRGELTLEKAKEVDEELGLKVQQLEERAGKVRGGECISKEDMENAKSEFATTKKEWKKRKGKVNEILDVVGEGMGKKVKEMYKECGIETDEDAKVDIKQLPDIKIPKNTNKVVPAKRKRA